MAMYDYYDDRQVPQNYYYPPSFEPVPVTFLDPRRHEVCRRDDRYMEDGYRYNYGRLHDPEVYWRDDRYMDDGYRYNYRLHGPDVYRRDDRYMDDGYRYNYHVHGPDDYRRDDRYVDDGYRYNYRLQDYSDYSHHGHMPQEQVVRRDGGADVGPWWLDSEYDPNYGGYVGMYHLPPQPWLYETEEDSSALTRVEMYVPLCCGECERKVRKHLKNIDGVKSVTADQWAKKVVVVGHDLRPDALLRRIRRDKPGSVFWSDRYH